MLTTYFKSMPAIARYRSGLAGPYLDSFTDWLAKRGYDNDAVRHLLPGAAAFGNWVQASGTSFSSLSCDVWNVFCDHLAKQGRLLGSRKQHTSSWRGAKLFTEFLRVQHGIVVVETMAPPSLPAIVTAFEHWMIMHRGVKPSTLATYRRHVLDLLSLSGSRPEQFNAAKLHTFVLAYAKHNGRAISQTRVTAARMFLRFLITTEHCPPGLDAAVPTIAEWRLAGLPRYLPPAEVESVLAACTGARSIDIRDRAILLLLARLGLRASDVAALKLSDINWTQGTFTVIGKSRHEAKLPLPQDVGDAILNYLRQARPRVNCDHVFITEVAPWEPITPNVVKHVATRAIRRAGVEAPSYGSHILRHSAATGLLRQGASLQVIGVVLRHRDMDTTALYAKVDTILLQQVIRPWPGATSC
ncbi:tyrosine-type recombinase/integrase [Parachitinimonas caeni]|uniref:Tyrosine-type recombinase/integrase n=1 Tax=Parachitinimonas caeni TaxID=3031301 RepID=A0ABT7E5P8_9NEIS|nr:tyrosine-type recombinase/integrase [Parachitinimonas caeni]MDK2126237.1 tyrosine-type recombinase/integrase [Parachitinimonas caeni]